MVFMSTRELIRKLHRGTEAERQLCLPEPQDSAGFRVRQPWSWTGERDIPMCVHINLCEEI